ncbi:hypothetical protein A5725_23995 [Mycobacterium kubicae]|uniref:hypothetical protein n=1 Tax=Mycobacterium kubicae TaxID=120959 RepID=UPI0007FEB4C4|nr:hypothetical protein [Mycobacterium kubicae]OBF17429.1 hypothetical protein A5725_23995 [Mycobacterium kubicae]
MADDELDQLYSAQPGEFTAQRTKLAAAAKKRGDADAAKRISGARKPTTAAWIVNRLALQHDEVRARLAELGDDLRAAHAAMDGDRIRDLSAEQHRLINELTRTALEDADVDNPSATLRDDVTGSLQAAIADPEVRARLGRLTKAERWSGFGGFGDALPVAAPDRTQRRTDEPKPVPPQGPDQQAAAARRELEKLRAAVAAAERAKAEADSVLAKRDAERAEARERLDEAIAALRQAERAAKNAENSYEKARQASRAAAERVKEAKAQLKRA